MLNLKVNVALFCLITIATQSIVADPVTLPPTNPTTKAVEPVTTPPTNPTTKAAEPVTTPPTNPTTKAADPVTLPPTNPTTKASDPVTTPSTNPKTKAAETVTELPTNPTTKVTEPVTTPPQTTKAFVDDVVTTPLQTTKAFVDDVVTTPLQTTVAPTTTAKVATTESKSEVEVTTTGETEATTVYEWDESDGCLYQDRLWPSIDGTKFYFCLPGTNTPVLQSCNRLTFFMMTKEMSGCIPFSEITTSCIDHDVLGSCTGNNLLQPQTDLNPTYFHICPGENETPLKLQCEEGKAFLHQDGYLGCFEWEQWREIRNCPMYG